MMRNPLGVALINRPLLLVIVALGVVALWAVSATAGPVSTTSAAATTTTGAATTTTGAATTTTGAATTTTGAATTTTGAATTTAAATTTTAAPTTTLTTTSMSTTTLPPSDVAGGVPFCAIKLRDGVAVEKTKLVPKDKVQRALDKGFEQGECDNPQNGQVMCKDKPARPGKPAKRANVLVPFNEVQKALDKGFYTLGECE